ncbi:MAG TPA: ABC-2 family transporter protein [Ktedonobacteraceae bacterium]|nr:ABC-2 family transporter protein [Ktedonobacteraceae bacterium]
MLRFYIEVARTSFRRQLIYRWANLAGLLTNIFFGVVFSYVIIALYHARPIAAGYNVTDTLRYTWLEQALLMVVVPFGWYDLMLTIRTGAVVSDLSKPCDFYWYWFSREFGRSAYYLLLRGLPIYLAGILLFGIGIPSNVQQWLVFALSITLSTFVGIAYRYLFNLTAFWVVEARAMYTLGLTLAQFLTGSYVPLLFFPSWLLAIVTWLPFNAFMNIPTQMFVGNLPTTTLLFDLFLQIAWGTLLTLGVRALTTVAARRVIVQGG